jgi:hypothetical protein
MAYYLFEDLSVVLIVIKWLKILGKYCLYVHEEQRVLMCVHSTSRSERHGI